MKKKQKICKYNGINIDINRPFKVIGFTDKFKEGEIIVAEEIQNRRYGRKFIIFKGLFGKRGYPEIDKIKYADDFIHYQSIKPGCLVGISNESQIDANNSFYIGQREYYIGTTEDGRFVTENGYMDINVVKYISKIKLKNK